MDGPYTDTRVYHRADAKALPIKVKASNSSSLGIKYSGVSLPSEPSGAAREECRRGTNVTRDISFQKAMATPLGGLASGDGRTNWTGPEE